MEAQIVSFLYSIGFTMVAERGINGFLPGIRIERNMTILYDRDLLSDPLDILHEAGHVAVVPALFRNGVAGDMEEAMMHGPAEEYIKTHPFIVSDENGVPIEDPVIRGLLQCGEAEAQAWSYAAAVAAGVASDEAFSRLDHFADVWLALKMHAHPGINGLIASRMTTRDLFPKMNRWLQN